jgi:hypothetical protein
MHEKKLGVTMLKIGGHHFNFFMRARQNQSYLLEYELRRSNIVHITVTNYKLKCDLLPKMVVFCRFGCHKRNIPSRHRRLMVDSLVDCSNDLCSSVYEKIEYQMFNLSRER